jgi:hypothetical protein
MSTERARRKFMHSTNSPLANFCFIEVMAISSRAFARSSHSIARAQQRGGLLADSGTINLMALFVP